MLWSIIEALSLLVSAYILVKQTVFWLCFSKYSEHVTSLTKSSKCFPCQSESNNGTKPSNSLSSPLAHLPLSPLYHSASVIQNTLFHLRTFEVAVPLAKIKISPRYQNNCFPHFIEISALIFPLQYCFFDHLFFKKNLYHSVLYFLCILITTCMYVCVVSVS